MKWSRPILRYSYPIICMEGLRKTTKDFRQGSWFLGRDSNPEPPEHKAGVPTTAFGPSGDARIFLPASEPRMALGTAGCSLHLSSMFEKVGIGYCFI